MATVANWIIWSLFLADVVVMLAVVPDRRLWFRKHVLEVAIVVLTPPFLPANLQALRVFGCYAFSAWSRSSATPVGFSLSTVSATAPYSPS